MKNIFIIAMLEEAEAMFGYLEPASTTPYKKFETDSDTIYVCGVGKTNAAGCAQHILSTEGTFNRLVNIGAVGSLSEKFRIGDIVSIESCYIHDVDLQAFNYKPGQYPGRNTNSYTLKRLDHLKPAVCVTGDQFLNNSEQKQRIVNAFGESVVDMELGAIAHICEKNNFTNLISVKVVSDGGDENADSDFTSNLESVLSKINLENI